MKISMQKDAALKALTRVLPFVASGSKDKPVLKSVLIIADNPREGGTGKLRFRGGDNKGREIMVDVPEAMVMTGGEVLIDAAKLADILRNAASDQVRLYVTTKGASISTDHAKYQLPTEDADLYPPAQSIANNPVLINAHTLANAIRQTSYACDVDSGRYAMNGILLKFPGRKAGELDVVATDGRRLALCSIKGTSCDKPFGIIVQNTSLKVLESLLRECPDVTKAELATNESRLQVTLPGIVAVFGLVEGRFPAYDKILGDPPPLLFSSPVDAFHRMVRQAAIVATSESRGVDLEVSANMVTAKGATADVGQSVVELPVSSSVDKPVVRCLNHSYLTDFLSRWNESATFECRTDPETDGKVLFTCDGVECFVMPLSKE